MSSVLTIRRPRSSWLTSQVTRSPFRSTTTSVLAALAREAARVRPRARSAFRIQKDGGSEVRDLPRGRAGGLLLLLQSGREVLEHLVGDLLDLLGVLLRLVRDVHHQRAHHVFRLGRGGAAHSTAAPAVPPVAAVAARVERVEALLHVG